MEISTAELKKENPNPYRNFLWNLNQNDIEEERITKTTLIEKYSKTKLQTRFQPRLPFTFFNNNLV